jgi:hypothetical protein
MNVVSNTGIVHKLQEGKICCSTVLSKQKVTNKKVTCKKCNCILNNLSDSEIINNLQKIIDENKILNITISDNDLRESLVKILRL